MRGVQVAHLIPSVIDIDGLVGHHLDIGTLEQALVLLGDHVRDPGLARIEIVPKFLHLVRGLSFGHFRLADPLAGKGVIGSPGEDGTGLHVIFHVVGRQFHVAVRNGHVAIIKDFALAVGENLDDRVPRLRKGRGVQGTLPLQGGRVDFEKGIRTGDGITDGQDGIGEHRLGRIRDVFDSPTERCLPAAPAVLGLSPEEKR